MTTVGAARRRVVVVGGGIAAQRCALALRRHGFDGAVEMLGAEPLPPYDRTLVSKDLLTDPTLGADELLLASPDEYERAGITLRLGDAAEGLSIGARRVRLRSGREVRFDHAVIACGGEAIRPPALACPGAVSLRTRADAAEVAACLRPGASLAIVGAGFIGTEVASAGVATGMDVTLIDGEAPLARALGSDVARRIARLHEDRGVRLRTRSAVRRVTRRGGRFVVECAHGPDVAADVVVLAVGSRPATHWLAGTGLLTDGAVTTDPHGRTRADLVFAAGDCCATPDPATGTLTRVEHWTTARSQGEAAAAALVGARPASAAVPFFWSEQHESKIQLAGSARADLVEVEDMDSGRTVVARYYRTGRLVGVCGINHPRAVAEARRALAAGAAMPTS